MTGWVHGDYVITRGKYPDRSYKHDASNASETAAEDLKETGVITASVLNVRKGIGTSSDVIAQLKKGMEVKVLEVRQ